MNKSMKSSCLSMLLCLALLCPAIINAQSEEYMDSVRVQALIDSLVIDSSVQYKDEEDIEDTGSGVAEEQHYFLSKELPENESYQLRRLSNAQKSELKADKDFWYADYSFDPKAAPEPREWKEPFWNSAVFQTILWIIIVTAFASILIMYLYNNNAGLFRRSRKITGDAEAMPETDDIFSIDYDREIAKAAAAAQYRLATRLLYLRLLRTMADKNIIQYKQDRTNLDYLIQLTSSSYYKNFFRLTRNYEYAWYGLFDINEDKFKRVHQDFNEMHQTLTSY